MKKLETTSTVLLKHHLKALKLPTMTAECEKVAARCAKENVDHLGFLLTPFKVFRVWYNTSLHRILRMIFGGDGKDVANSDSRSVRRALPCGRHGSGRIGAAAAAGAAGPALRGRRPTAIHQATPLLATRRGDGGDRHADPR